MRNKIASSLFLFCLLNSGVCFAGFDEGEAAYQKGDYAIALKNWKPLANRGDANAQNSLGKMFGNGQGVPQSFAQAAKWFRKAAEQGHSIAQTNLALMYRDGNGQGVPISNAQAYDWFSKAAAQGNADAQNELGVMHANGQGLPQNIQIAADWFRKSANQGNVIAQKNLAMAQGMLNQEAANRARAQQQLQQWKMEKMMTDQANQPYSPR